MSWLQFQRTKGAKMIDHCVLATSTDPSDDVLADYFTQHQESVYRGSLNNVLSRYYNCAKEYGAQHVVRITADCPLMDPEIIDKVVTAHLEQGNDYTAMKNFPVGLSVEVCTFTALEKTYYEANLRSQREHVTLYIYKHPELFKINRVVHEPNLAHLRWTVDHKEDFIFVTKYMKPYILKTLIFI